MLVEDFAYLVTSSGDWAPAIQKAMDLLADAGGGSVHFLRRGIGNHYPCSQLFWRDRVVLDGGGRGTTNTDGIAWLQATGLASNSFFVTTDADSGERFGAIGMGFRGDGVGGTTGGLNFTSVDLNHPTVGVQISHVLADRWSREAMKGDGGGFMIKHCGMEGWQAPALAPTNAYVGVLSIGGADNMIVQNEVAGPSVRTVTTNLRIGCGCFEYLNVSLIEGNIFEGGDAGVNAWGNDNRFISNRYDTNGGYGLILRGSNCLSMGEYFGRNSFSTHNEGMFDHIWAPPGESYQNKVISPFFYNSLNANGDWAYPRFCINDEASGELYKNSYIFPGGIEGPLDIAGRQNYGTGFFSCTNNAFYCAGMTYENRGVRHLDQSATPSVLLANVFSGDSWLTPTTITNFKDGFPGQRVLICGNYAGNMQIANGPNIMLGSLPSPYTIPVSGLEFINLQFGTAEIWSVIGH